MAIRMLIFLLLVLYFGDVSGQKVVRDGDMELSLVHVVWRHGDRSPIVTFNSDPFQEDYWKFGGGGWGQLSPIGMKQHLNLGKLLRNRYVDVQNSTHPLLPAVYSSKAVYVRSTDLNRTLISATANLLGMYGQEEYGSIGGFDYPDVEGWPKGFIPMPIHTVDYDTDYIGNMDCDCPRRTWLWNMVKQSDFIQSWLQLPNVSYVLNTTQALINQNAELEDFWVVPDALYIEQIHYNETLRQLNTWYSDEFYDQMTVVNDQIYLFLYGVFNGQKIEMQNMDMGRELLKLRAGSLMNDISDRIALKSSCQYINSSSTHCKWINELKYYAYSAHDETIYSVLVALGIQEYTIKPHGYPLYAAAVIIEFWRNTTSNSDYFKVLYHAQDGDGINVFTSNIPGCSSDYCSIDVLRNVSMYLKPDKPMSEWCTVVDNNNNQSIISYFITILTVVLVQYCLN